MKIGLVGCGNIGRLRAQAVRRSGRHRLVAAVDVDEERVAQVAGGEAKTGSDWREVLSSTPLDAVVVSTPPSTHAEICRGAADAGCHVLCEKPLARSPDECRAILDVAEDAGVRIATGFNFRFFPPVRRLRALVEDGVLGGIVNLRGHAGYRNTDPSPAWLHDVQETGGGALRDIGVHLIDLARVFLGDIDRVEGVATNGVLRIPGCEDNADLVLTSAGGGVANLHVTWTEWRDYRFWLEVVGTEAVARLSCFPMYLSVSPRTRGSLSWRDRYHLFPRTLLAEKLGSYETVVVESLARELDSFEDLVSGRLAALATGPDGARAVEIAASVTGRLGDELRPAPTTQPPGNDDVSDRGEGRQGTP